MNLLARLRRGARPQPPTPPPPVLAIIGGSDPVDRARHLAGLLSRGMPYRAIGNDPTAVGMMLRDALHQLEDRARSARKHADELQADNARLAKAVDELHQQGGRVITGAAARVLGGGAVLVRDDDAFGAPVHAVVRIAGGWWSYDDPHPAPLDGAHRFRVLHDPTPARAAGAGS